VVVVVMGVLLFSCGMRVPVQSGACALQLETGHHFTSIEKSATKLREELPTDFRGAHQHTTSRKEALYHS